MRLQRISKHTYTFLSSQGSQAFTFFVRTDKTQMLKMALFRTLLSWTTVASASLL